MTGKSFRQCIAQRPPPRVPITMAHEIRAEAAAWLARLHADGRDARDEAAFRIWLNADPRHALAFEAVDQAWSDIGGLSDLRPVRARRYE